MNVITFVGQGPGLLASTNEVKYSCVHDRAVNTQRSVEGRPDIPHRVQLFPHWTVAYLLLVTARL